MKLTGIPASIAPWPVAPTLGLCFGSSSLCELEWSQERLPGYFIDREGNVERGHGLIADTRGNYEADASMAVGGGITVVNTLSEEEALNRLKRVLNETGQLVVRAADGTSTAWFAGIGDPGDLFFELRPQEAWQDRDELVMGAICSLAEAERVVSRMYRGRTDGLFEKVPAGRGDGQGMPEM